MSSFASRSLSFVFLILVLLGSTVAQIQGPQAPLADLDSYVATSMKTFAVPGMAGSALETGDCSGG